MNNVIDFTEHKKKMLKNLADFTHDFTPIENAAISEIQERILAKYIPRLINSDYSFSFQGSPEQAESIQNCITALREDLNKIIFDLIGDLLKSEIFLYFKENPR